MTPGAHFCIGIPGTVLDRDTRQLLKLVRPTGIILFGRNIASAAQLAGLTHGLRRLLGGRLLICLDHEGGRVNRLKNLTGVVPSALQLGFLGRRDRALQHGRLTGRLLREVGVNVNLAPVLDLHLKPKTDNSVPDRCWSRDPAEVARLAGAFLHGMQEEGVIGCGKHFPGYGAADKDPHLVLPRVDRSYRQLTKEDLVPYRRLMQKGSDRDGGLSLRRMHLVMLCHAHVKAFHGARLTPASVSPRIVHGLLREEVGFTGVAMTDDLEMGAILRTMSIGTATVGSLQSGADWILICHTARAVRQGFQTALAAMLEGGLEARRLHVSRERLDRLARLPHPIPRFSEKRFDQILKDIRGFTARVFSALPDSLCVIDERWGPIGEKN